MPKTTAQVRTINPVDQQIRISDSETGKELVFQIVRFKGSGEVSVRLEGPSDLKFATEPRSKPQDCLKDRNSP